MKINDLASFRYFITMAPDGPGMQFGSPPPYILKMAATYQHLIHHHNTQLRENSTAPDLRQVVRNNATALRAFLKTVGKTEWCPVGDEMSDDFDRALRTHLEAVQLSPRSLVDRKSLLLQWKNSCLTLNKDVAAPARRRGNAAHSGAEKTPFETTLMQALRAAGIAPKTAARRACISPSAVGRWARGALPNVRTVASLEKLESVLPIRSGTLTQAFNETMKKRGDPAVSQFSKRHKELTKNAFLINERNLLPQLAQEWDDFFGYKTTSLLRGLKRGPRGRWTLVNPQKSSHRLNRFNTRGGMVCPTADIVWTRVATFIGFLQLSIDKGGLGLPPHEAQTLAWFNVSDAVDAFLQFMESRSGGMVHGGHQSVCGLVSSMVHPVTGYLAQKPGFFANLPSDVVQDSDWTKMCDETRALCMVWECKTQGSFPEAH